MQRRSQEFADGGPSFFVIAVLVEEVVFPSPLTRGGPIPPGYATEAMLFEPITKKMVKNRRNKLTIRLSET